MTSNETQEKTASSKVTLACFTDGYELEKKEFLSHYQPQPDLKYRRLQTPTFKPHISINESTFFYQK